MIPVHCESCGSVHIVSFSDFQSFQAQMCRVEHAPLFRSRRAYDKVYREFQNDLMEGAVAV
jgi:DNA-directed RNA polymerase subunit N (RpoN/RPB10)